MVRGVDPQFLLFDTSEMPAPLGPPPGGASNITPGVHWLVKSQTVWIQARYAPIPVTHSLSVMKEIAVGGPFLKSSNDQTNILRISALEATFNGQPIIPGFPDTWHNQDPEIGMVADGNGELLPGEEDRQGKEMHVVHAPLPESVIMQINRWN